MTVVALTFWPWQWSMDAKEGDNVDDDGLRTSEEQQHDYQNSESQGSEDQDQEQVDEMAKSVFSFRDRLAQSIDWQSRLRRCLLLAALACILRPTNVLIWMCIACFTVLRTATKGRMLPLPWEGAQIWVHITSLSLLPATKKERLILLREMVLCGYERHHRSLF